MKPLPDITGQKFNRLLVKQMVGFDEKHHTLCLCLCDCGGQTIEKAAEVISGHVKSCGQCLIAIRKPDLTGRRFGRLVAVRYVGKDSRNNRAYECQCDCGRTKIVAATLLIHGYVESCKCLLEEKRKENILRAQQVSTTHGLSGTPIYRSWESMIARCFDPDQLTYPKYGGVGITVCQYLKESPLHLLKMIGERPKGKTIDRIKGTGSYTCGQCPECLEKKWPFNIRWLTLKEQAVNRKSTVWVMIDGVLKTRMQAAEALGIPYKKAVYLLRKFEVTTKPIEFKPVAGVVPEGTKAGEEFDMVCTFRVKNDGNICLVVLGDTKMAGYATKGEDKGKPSYKDEHDAMQEAAKQPMPGSGGGQVQTGYA